MAAFTGSIDQPQPATLHLNTWAGRRSYRVQLTGQTRTRYYFQAEEDIPMPRRRFLKSGEHGAAPKDAVSLIPSSP